MRIKIDLKLAAATASRTGKNYARVKYKLREAF